MEAQMDKPMRDLIEIIHFTENVSTKIHGLLDEAEIYRTVKEEFAKSKRYSATIFLLTADGSKLRIVETSMSLGRLKAAEKATGLRTKEHKIDLNKLSVFSQVVKEGKTVQTNVSDLLSEMFPRPLAYLISKIMGYERRPFIATPLIRYGKIIGALAVSSTELAEHFIPSLRNLARHISTALELAAEHTERKRMEEELVNERHLLRVLMDNIPDTIYFKDTASRFIRINKAHAKVLGINDPKEAIGKTDFDFSDEEFAREAYEDEQKIVRTGTPMVGKIERPKRPHAQFRWVSATKVPIINKEGQVTGIVGISRDITESKRVEEALRKSEENFQRMTTHIEDVLYSVDGETQEFRYVSPAFERLLGYTLEDIRQMGGRRAFLSRVIRGGEFAEQERNFARLKSRHMADIPYRYEAWWRCKDGSLRCLEDHWIPVYDGEHLISTDGVLRDITERKKAEEELIRLSSAVKISTDSIVISDVDAKIIDVNEATLKMYGSDEKGDLIEKNSFDLIAPEDREKALAGMKEILERGYIKSREYNIMTKDGTKIPVDMSVALMKDADGKPIGFVGISRDITERKQMDEALRDSERKIRVLFENLPQKIFYKDKKSVYVSCNDNYARDLNIKTDEIAGKTDYNFYPKELAEKYRADDKRIVESGKTEDIEESYIQDGQERIVHTVKTPIKDEKGNTVGVLGIFWDITERKKMEEDRNKLLHRYGKRVKELRCLYGMSKFLENPETSLEGILKETINLLPPAWQYPDLTCARIVFKGREFKTKNFKETHWEQQANIKVNGKNAGTVEVYYLEEKTKLYEGPFLKEERDLINAVAERLGKAIERLKTEEMVRESEERFRELFENAYDLIFTLDLNGNFTSANNAALKVSGYTAEEIAKMNIAQILPPEVLQAAKMRIARIARGEKLGPYEYEFINKDGSRAIIELSSRAMLAEDKPVGIHCIARDITERKKAEEKLRFLKEFNERIVNSIGDVLLVIDPNDYTIITANDAVLKQLKLRKEELIGKTCYETTHHRSTPCEPPHHTCPIQESLKTGKAVTLEHTHFDKDNNEIYVEVSARPVRSQEGKIIHFVHIARDVTERKKMEEKLKDYTVHLEEMVEERTRELKEAQEQLLKAERLTAIGETAAMVGHDLRNPLQVIINTAYLGEEMVKSMPPPCRELAEKKGLEELFGTVGEQVEYMNKIVSDLQDFARPLKPELVETSLHQLINDTLSTITVPETVKVSMEIEGDLDFPKLMVDPTMMKRVFINLVTNAVQAMPDGGKMTIRASKTNEAAFISVQDTGVGIPEENLDKLFHPLFTTKPKGTGFGLPVCKRLVEAHDGNITVESKVGRGSTFTVKIPLRKEVS